MKLEQFRKDFKKLGIDACLLSSHDPNFHYFVQKKIFDAALVITKKGKPHLLLTPLEKIRSTKFNVISVANFYDEFSSIAKRHKIKVLGINHNALYTSSYKRIIKHVARTKDLFDYFNELRSLKTNEELTIFRTGCKITCRIMNELIKNIKAKKFKQEGDIKNWLKIQTFLTDNDLSFEPVVACGKNAAVPHYNGNNRLQKGFIIIDYGLRYKGYCTDMTRTLYLGTPTKKDVELYNLILKCQTETIDFIANNYHNGVTGTQAFNYACSILGKHSRYFIHSLGHGIGVKVHELPTLSSNPADKLIKGTVFTVEPGYYNGLGIRIEDDIYLGHHLEVLTKCVPKKLIIVK